ncbi:flavin reductase family protein [Streptomyces sp. AC512_CC834]|uniref:flavin reductase family protein n=1 Tax=Streptomyces sp. AC512_CC834 TaxID=2823691 RepID=UPI001C26C300|nr:flavin reductase family protein [Streptomyces sp. AC512_CC834]
MNSTPAAAAVATARGIQGAGPEAGRRALRRFASGITVLTVNHDGVRHGTTVSAVVAISREPLLLGACLRSSSAFTALAREAGVFSVNVLSSEQASLARQFAVPGRHRGDAQFADVKWTTDNMTGAPLIDGCLAHMACALTGDQEIGDHHLLTAEVLAGDAGQGAPLLAFAGQLWHEGLSALDTRTPEDKE